METCSARPGSAGERPRTALTPARPSLERLWESFCERSGLTAGRGSPKRDGGDEVEASSSSGLTHGSSIVFAGNPVASMRRRTKAPAVVRAVVFFYSPSRGASVWLVWLSDAAVSGRWCCTRFAAGNVRFVACVHACVVCSV